MVILRATLVYRSDETTVVAVESLDRQHHRYDVGIHLYGKIEAIAIVVKNTSGVTALDLENKPLSIDELMRSVPGLETIVNGD